MTARTIEGKAYAVPYDAFESTVTVGGEQYIVEFKVTESPSGGTVVHSVDIVKSPEPEFRALYDRYMKSGAGNQNVETDTGEGYNGSGDNTGQATLDFPESADDIASSTQYNDPASSEQSYESSEDEGPDPDTPDNQDHSGFNFNKYLRSLIGNPPKDMIDPHAHHILFRTGLGPKQKALVIEGHHLLRKYGIDPIFGKENLVWAPWRIKGQHDYNALKYVVDQLKAVEALGGEYEDICEKLEELGKTAARRR
jgi:hypothetical protein